jgi:hypothetical protein
MISPLRNPYHNSGAIVARLAVSVATLIWSVIVLLVDDALRPTSYGDILTRYASEDMYAWAAFCAAAPSIYRIVRQSRPHPLGIVGYVMMMAGWGFVASILILSQRPIQPTSTACTLTITALAVYAFLANPRLKGSDAAGN